MLRLFIGRFPRVGVLVFGQIDSRFLGVSLQPLVIEGFDSGSRDAESHPAVSLGPPDSFPLQVGFLQLMGPTVGVGNGHCVIRFFAGELTFAGHGFSFDKLGYVGTQSLIVPNFLSM